MESAHYSSQNAFSGSGNLAGRTAMLLNSILLVVGCMICVGSMVLVNAPRREA